jgi:hypothetical protein
MILTRLGIATKLLEHSSCKPFTTSNNIRCPHFIVVLPTKQPTGLSLRVMDTCTGVEACLQLDLKIIKRSFKAWIMIDPCKFIFSLGFEKWVLKKTLSKALLGEYLLKGT